ncbi:hypothetical protein ABHV50_004234 [Vibrio vulnificus]
MAFKFGHFGSINSKVTPIAAALGFLLSASAAAAVIGQGESESFSLDFKGAVDANIGPQWQFEIPATTPTLLQNLDVKLIDAVDTGNNGWVWTVTNQFDLLKGTIATRDGKNNLNPEITIAGQVVSDGAVVTTSVDVKDDVGGVIGSLELKDLKHWAGAAYFNSGRPYGFLLAVKLSNGEQLDSLANYTAGTREMLDALESDAAVLEAVPGASIGRKFDGMSGQADITQSKEKYSGQRLVTVDSSRLTIAKDKVASSNSWNASLPIVVTVK